ncbi:peptidase inhibitor family I36 protein [Nocardioides sp. SYSU D00038]|uniref:peptidase inhibitor family I36 protein n=1 Tax=Nocardioides sp. SYSU D00038 TaxID=2812554 RepID=UPI0019687C41|nr:peptidase inhibitor family I36 protein [Nocardioides sp. SYSU D00038]
MRILKPLAVVATAAAVSVVGLPPASAVDINDAPGPNGKITFLEHDSFRGTGQMESRTSYDTNFKNDIFNDEASAVVNKSAYFWLLYDDTGYRDRAVCVRPKSFYSLKVAGFNDKMSSAQRMTKRKATSCGSWAVIGIKFD